MYLSEQEINILNILFTREFDTILMNRARLVLCYSVFLYISLLYPLTTIVKDIADILMGTIDDTMLMALQSLIIITSFIHMYNINTFWCMILEVICKKNIYVAYIGHIYTIFIPLVFTMFISLFYPLVKDNEFEKNKLIFGILFEIFYLFSLPIQIVFTVIPIEIGRHLL